MAILNLFYHVDPVGGENGSRTLPLLTSKIFNSHFTTSKKFLTPIISTIPKIPTNKIPQGAIF
jgi:hypothetical protein